MEKVLDRVLNAQRDSMMEGFTQLSDSLGRAGASTRNTGKLTSTIKVEPRMAWPEFGDKNRNPEEAENFIRQFEGICRMANNGTGMRYEDMVHTIGNRLKGNRNMLFDNIVQDAFEDGSLVTEPQGVDEKIKLWSGFSMVSKPPRLCKRRQILIMLTSCSDCAPPPGGGAECHLGTPSSACPR